MSPVARKYWRPILFFAAMLPICGGLWLAKIPYVPEVRLWDSAAPLAVGDMPQDIPILHIYLPAAGRRGGTGVIVCPGGGFRVRVPWEGEAMAKWLNSLGITAFVLDYRLSPRYRHDAMVLDVERAIRFIHFHSDRYGLNPRHIGVIGFSAGGYLAAVSATDSASLPASASDPVDSASGRPDFMMLGYPLTTLMPPYTNEPAVSALLGPDAPDELRRRFSPLLHVMHDMPPTFLFLTGDDHIIPPQSGLQFYRELEKAGVPAEMHIFASGPHGFGLADGREGVPDDRILAAWKIMAGQWMNKLGVLDVPAGK